jgi:hypothetical protein
MNMHKKTNFVLLLSIVCVATTLGQLRRGSVGLTTTLFQSPNLGLAYAASANTRISANVGFTFTHDSSGNASTYHVSVSGWRYVYSAENMSGFFGGSFGVDAQSDPSATTSSLDLAALFGTEYWFSSRFALYGTAQLHFGTGKIAGATVSRLYTSAETGLTWYL